MDKTNLSDAQQALQAAMGRFSDTANQLATIVTEVKARSGDLLPLDRAMIETITALSSVVMALQAVNSETHIETLQMVSNLARAMSGQPPNTPSRRPTVG